MDGVRVHDLGKRFRRFRQDRPRSLKEALLRGLRGIAPSESFWALRHVEFAVEPGRVCGIIGHNGAGKSTLLRLIGGIGRADEGAIAVPGRVIGLLDLGAGFHPDLSGRENVYVNGVVAGLTRSEVRERFDSIVEFAELAASIDDPLRTYSQGMRQRLGFSVATHADADALLIDELFSVGDQRFEQKCLSRIEHFKQRGCAILISSHSLISLRKICDQAIQLREGEIVARGAVDEVLDGYERERIPSHQ